MTFMHKVYNDFMRDRLLNDDSHLRFDTFEEALKHTDPSDLDFTEEIHYTDGLDNWFHCSSCGHDFYSNDLLIKRLREGKTCLTAGYYVLWQTEGKEYRENPFERCIKGYTYRYFDNAPIYPGSAPKF